MSEPLSARNQRIQAAVRLHRGEERKRTGLTLLEGPHLVEEARLAGVELTEVFSTSDEVLVTQAALERLSSTKSPQSPVAVARIPNRPMTPGRSALVAWNIADPGNLGTMIRTAAAFGLDVMTTSGSADIWSPKVLRAGAGAHFRTGLGTVDLAGYTVVAAVVDGEVDPTGLPAGQVALLIGSEAHGLPAEVVQRAELRVAIPMPGGIESLNAASAAAILCYELARRPGAATT